ncbi:jg12411, partial [Pararge aegeria aegeria]
SMHGNGGNTDTPIHFERARLAGVIQRGAASVAIRTTDGPRPTKCRKGPGTEEEGYADDIK